MTMDIDQTPRFFLVGYFLDETFLFMSPYELRLSEAKEK